MNEYFQKAGFLNNSGIDTKFKNKSKSIYNTRYGNNAPQNNKVLII